MGKRAEIVTQFTEAQTSRDEEKIAAVAASLADNAVMAGGRMGDVSGKDAIIDRLKNPPQRPGGGGGGGMMGQISWSDPVEEGATVKVSASTPMGSIVRTFSFDDDDRITRIEFARG